MSLIKEKKDLVLCSISDFDIDDADTDKLSDELKDSILRNQTKINFTSNPSVYFLLDKNIIVYVGKSIDPKSRIEIHKGNKKFDGYYILNCSSEEEMNNLEGFYIFKYTPKYNKSLPQKHNPYLSKIVSIFLGEDLRNTIKNKRLKIQVSIINNRLYFNIDDLKEVKNERKRG